MPGPASDQQKATYRALRAKGYSQVAASKEVGLSEDWGYKLEREDREALRRREQVTGGEPKSPEELDGGVKDTLKDFNLFAEIFLARTPVPWRLDAANRVVGWLLDKTEDTYAVINLPPRAGKTTLFTHDIPLWLICGGGSEDPEIGRAIRILLGHRTKTISQQYVTRLRNTLELTTPFYEKEGRREAELVLCQAFGRFVPKKTQGEVSLWRDDRFVVAQIGERRVYQKEPTVQAASRESGFLGTRVDLGVWDDLVVSENCRSATVAESLAEWWENEAEERIEPGGVNLLVGQRLSNLDLYKSRLQKTYVDDQGEYHQNYEHIVYPAHNEKTCVNGAVTRECTQWDARDEGCLLDADRLKVEKLWKAQSKGKYRTVYQQEDANPEDVLVQEAWIYGGKDADGYDADGCLDHDRGFHEWPEISGLIDIVCVDPSVSKFWAFEWWAIEPVAPHRFWLIWGQRKKMPAGTDTGFLDYNPKTQMHVGEMERLQNLSGELGHPIRVWVVEQNAAHKYLTQNHAFKTWQKKWPRVTVFPHSTQRNKIDSTFGVASLIPQSYKLGLSRLPYMRGTDVRNYIKLKVDELTKYPDYPTDDTVMADWFGKIRREEILYRARVFNTPDFGRSDGPALPPYLKELTRAG